jgi:hypothetical protein
MPDGVLEHPQVKIQQGIHCVQPGVALKLVGVDNDSRRETQVPGGKPSQPGIEHIDQNEAQHKRRECPAEERCRAESRGLAIACGTVPLRPQEES